MNNSPYRVILNISTENLRITRYGELFMLRYGKDTKQYAEEWQQLIKLKQPTIERLCFYHDKANGKTKNQNMATFERSVGDLVNNLTQNKKTLSLLMDKAPQLAKQLRHRIKQLRQHHAHEF